MAERESAGKNVRFHEPAYKREADKYQAVYFFVFHIVPRDAEQDEYKGILDHKRRRAKYIEQCVPEVHMNKHKQHRKVYKIFGAYNAALLFADFVYARYIQRGIKKRLENIARILKYKYCPDNLHDNAGNV